MTAITAKFPGDLRFKVGDRLTLDAVLTDGGLTITRLVRRDPVQDRKETVAHLLKRWTGAGGHITEDGIHTARTARVMEKHVK